MHALDALVGPVGVLVGRADEEDVAAGRVGAVRARRIVAGLRRRCPSTCDIFAPSRVIIPCVKSAWNGSCDVEQLEVGERLA